MSALTLVDSNVILDILTEDPVWSNWSTDALATCAEAGRLAINPLIYAEVSVRFASIEALEEALPAADYTRLPLPWEAGFLAGKCFLTYRREGGARTSLLPDFYIGAHAAVADLTLLTRDPRHYRRFYPNLRLVSPQ